MDISPPSGQNDEQLLLPHDEQHDLPQQQHVEWETGYESVGENMSSTLAASSPITAQRQPLTSLLVSESSNPMLIDSISEMTTPTLPLPQRVEPTLKEKLLERERQRRVETERGRWKRQFALSNGNVLDDDGGEEQTLLRENGSVVGTVGEESSVARNDLLEDDEEDDEVVDPSVDGAKHVDNHDNNKNNNNATASNNLGYTMERFLSETTGAGGEGGGSVAEVDMVAAASPALPPISELVDAIISSDGAPSPVPPDKGVVMERFLAEQIAIQQQHHHAPTTSLAPVFEGDTVDPNVGHSVSFDTSEQIASSSVVELALEPSSVPDYEALLEEEPLERTSSTSFRVGASSAGVNMHSSLANLSVIVNASMDDLGHTSLHSNPSFEALEEPDSPISNVDHAQSLDNASPALSLEQHPPRVLRLTEAEIQELTAIEEASIGNAPPSDREDESDDSLVGELVGGARFELTHGGSIVDPTAAGTFSQGTQTTAMESISIISDVVLVMGTNSANAVVPGLHASGSGSRVTAPSHHLNPGVVSDQVVADHHSLDGIETTSSVSSHIVLSPGASSDDQQGGVSVSVNPPSDIGEPPLILIQDVVVGGEADLNNLVAAVPPTTEVSSESIARHIDLDKHYDDKSMDDPMVAAAVDHSEIVNRKIRPGMFTNLTPPRGVSRKSPKFSGQSMNTDDMSPMKRSTSMPSARNFMVDGFDFDKNDPSRSPAFMLGDDSMRDLPGDDLWVSPQGKKAPPFSMMRRHNEGNESEEEDLMHPFYSSTAAMYGSTTVLSAALPPPPNDYSLPLLNSNDMQSRGTAWNNQVLSGVPEEAQPLLREIPAGMSPDGPKMQDDGNGQGRKQGQAHTVAGASLGTVVNDAFNEIQYDSPETVAAMDAESASYLQSSILKRAYSDRMFVLCITMLVEIPVLLIVFGGSDRLCSLIGKRRYELMMGFLPVASAISGNVGLQASMLTTRAISHQHVTKQSFPQWLLHEIGAALFLGFGMGCMLGLVACIASSGDFAFGFTIMAAQWVSIVTAGCTGAVSPLLFSLIFGRDSDKWISPLGTAMQDIVSSFAMVILSYWILVVLGRHQVDRADACGVPETSG